MVRLARVGHNRFVAVAFVLGFLVAGLAVPANAQLPTGTEPPVPPGSLPDVPMDASQDPPAGPVANLVGALDPPSSVASVQDVPVAGTVSNTGGPASESKAELWVETDAGPSK